VVVDGITGAPRAGLLVLAAPVDAMQGWSAFARAESVVTGPEGRFVIGGLPPGVVRVLVGTPPLPDEEPPGFSGGPRAATVDSGTAPPPGSVVASWLPVGRVVHLGFALTRPTPGAGPASGRHSAGGAGAVPFAFDDSPGPASDAEERPWRVVVPRPGGVEVRVTIGGESLPEDVPVALPLRLRRAVFRQAAYGVAAGAGGRAAFRNIPPGVYHLESPAVPGLRRRVRVLSGGTGRVGVDLPARPGETVVTVVPGAGVPGGLRLALHADGADPWEPGGARLPGPPLAPAEGGALRAALPGLLPGPYRLGLTAEIRRTVAAPGRGPVEVAFPYLAHSRTVEVAPGGLAVEIPLPPARPVCRIVDARGRAVAGARVMRLPPREAGAETPLAHADRPTDAAGRVWLHLAEAETADLLVTAGPRGTHILPAVRLDPAGGASAVLPAPGGWIRLGFRSEVAGGPDGPGEAAGTPFAFLVHEDPRLTMLRQLRAGRVEWPVLPLARGRWRIFLLQDGYACDARTIRIGPPARPEGEEASPDRDGEESAAAGPVEVVLEQVPSGSVQVRLGDGSDPLAGVELHLRDANGRVVPRLRALHAVLGWSHAPYVALPPTDETGRTSIHGLRPGRYRVGAGGADPVHEVEVRACETTRLRIVRPPAER
jgi:hypothetical protein